MGISILQCQSLGFQYGNSTVLHDITFEIESGLFYAILGRNGSGKTTLLHCLNGILKPCSGNIEIERQDITTMSRKQVARLISLLPQEHLDIFPFKVLDVVVMGRAPFLKITQTPGAYDYELALNALKILAAEKLAHSNFNRISGGERQIVLLASALVQTSKIMLLDEPTNHLDFNNQYRLLARIKELCRMRQTSVIATMHDPNMAMLYADRVIMLKQGSLVANGRIKDVMTTHNINTLYETRTIEINIMNNKKIFLPESAMDPFER